MVIEKITLKNFRVYYGTHELEFASNEVQNISIVAGNNGYGKTSFLTSLVWALYGKLIADVDDKYRQDIQESGGYKRYCEKLMNLTHSSQSEQLISDLQSQLSECNTIPKQKEIKSAIEDATTFSVTLVFTELVIPSVPCEKLEIKRSFNIKSGNEQIDILIDGKVNELTKGTSPEIFINDFILPKEIAKFFFFDAEKIVSLAEIKSNEEKRQLSQAYAEVLGIKKYTDLRSNLVNLRLRLRRTSAVKADRQLLEKLNSQLLQQKKLTELYQQQIVDRSEVIQTNKLLSDKYQEKLIREGSTLTLDELKRLRDQQSQVLHEQQKLKSSFNELLDLAPFAILTKKMDKIKNQVEAEMNSSAVSRSLVENKYQSILEAIQAPLALPSLNINDKSALIKLIKDTLLPENGADVKPLLDFTAEQQNRFLGVHENLRNTYSKQIKRVIAEQRRINAIGWELQKKLQNAESKERDPIVTEIRASKQQVDDTLKQLESDITTLQSKKQHADIEIQTLSRKISELSKKISLEDKDVEKDTVAERLVHKLETFINELKVRKKASLEKNIQIELNRLMHKADFVKSVNVIIAGDLIDIELYDRDNFYINKDLLSKGEQQLYATALLKALIKESNIRFPVFIDSPLQKFDQVHSGNIIRDFYPELSSQVILFPLLQKELSEDEYQLLIGRVGKAYLIEQEDKYKSAFRNIVPQNLFQELTTV